MKEYGEFPIGRQYSVGWKVIDWAGMAGDFGENAAVGQIDGLLCADGAAATEQEQRKKAFRSSGKWSHGSNIVAFCGWNVNGDDEETGMRKRKKRLDAATEARRRARKVGPKPSGTKVIPDKRRKTAKHKQDWEAEVGE
jgi:hypothetical protein